MRELFADDRNVRLLEEELAANPAGAAPQCLIDLAWQLRQRDRGRTLDLANEAEESAAASQYEPRLRARIALLRAEIHWESGDFRDA